jgi:hypothetical protein
VTVTVSQIFLEGRALHCIYCDGDRRPMGWGHGWGDAVADAEGIARLRRGPYIGVATGRINGIVVVDVDPRNGGDETFAEHLAWLPQTREHRSRRGGRHLVYRYPPQGIPKFQGREGRLPGIDILSDTIGAIWPPSPGYTVIDDRAMVECPERLCELIGEMGVKPDCDVGVTPISPVFPEPIAYEVNYAERALLNAWFELHNCPAGCRNHLLNVLAYKMGRLVVRGWIERGRVEEYLLRACRANGLLDDPEDGPAKCRATLASGIEAGMRRPYQDIRWRVAEPKNERETVGVNLKPEEEEKP